MSPPVESTRPTIAALRFRLADLQRDREETLLAEDFAFMNGSIRRIDAEIGALQAELRARSRGPA